MSKIDRKLRQQLAAAPDQTVSLIVRTAGDPAPHLARLRELGMRVKRQFKLLPGVSVTGRAAAALSLSEESWILKLEEDRPISTARAARR
jgi:hypothetical protein